MRGHLLGAGDPVFRVGTAINFRAAAFSFLRSTAASDRGGVLSVDIGFWFGVRTGHRVNRPGSGLYRPGTVIKSESVVLCLDVDQTVEPTFAPPLKNTVSKRAFDLRGDISTPLIDRNRRAVFFRIEPQGRWAGKMLVGLNQDIRRTVVDAAGGGLRASREGVVCSHGYTEKQSRYEEEIGQFHVGLA